MPFKTNWFGYLWFLSKKTPHCK